MGFYY